MCHSVVRLRAKTTGLRTSVVKLCLSWKDCAREWYDCSCVTLASDVMRRVDMFN